MSQTGFYKDKITFLCIESSDREHDIQVHDLLKDGLNLLFLLMPSFFWIFGTVVWMCQYKCLSSCKTEPVRSCCFCFSMVSAFIQQLNPINKPDLTFC